MNENVKKFILEVINFKTYDKSKLSYYLDNVEDYKKLQEYIFDNRLAGITYCVLKETNLIGKVDKDLREALKEVYEKNKKTNDELNIVLSDISNIQNQVPYKYALLKGAYLIPMLYDKGQRVSNDIDILISQKHIDLLDECFSKNGYVQKVYNEELGYKEATRKEKIFARMNFGELIPYFKDYSLKYINPAIIDINISLDFQAKENLNLVDKMLENVVEYEINNQHKLYTLDKVDFFIHLCAHLFKEATIFDWVKELRDTDLFKYCDIYAFLLKYSDETFFNELKNRIKAYHLEKECYYTFSTSMMLFPYLNNNKELRDIMNEIKPQNLNFMKQIYYPIKKTLYEYNMEFIDWIFCENKLELLREIIDEKEQN